MVRDVDFGVNDGGEVWRRRRRRRGGIMKIEGVSMGKGGAKTCEGGFGVGAGDGGISGIPHGGKMVSGCLGVARKCSSKDLRVCVVGVKDVGGDSASAFLRGGMMCGEGENGVFGVGNRGSNCGELPIVAPNVKMLGYDEAAINVGELEFSSVCACPSRLEEGRADFGGLSVFDELIDCLMFGIDRRRAIVVISVLMRRVDVSDDNDLGVGEGALGDESVDFGGKGGGRLGNETRVEVGGYQGDA
jgi:hypothetical protein